jgi:hypothetical protein
VVFSPELTSFSTFILLMSSLMMALAVTAIQKGNLKSCRWSLLTTIFFGLIFLGCQVYEFNHFVHERHMTISNSLLGTTFYTLTGTAGNYIEHVISWSNIEHQTGQCKNPKIFLTFLLFLGGGCGGSRQKMKRKFLVLLRRFRLQNEHFHYITL